MRSFLRRRVNPISPDRNEQLICFFSKNDSLFQKSQICMRTRVLPLTRVLCADTHIVQVMKLHRHVPYPYHYSLPHSPWLEERAAAGRRWIWTTIDGGASYGTPSSVNLTRRRFPALGQNYHRSTSSRHSPMWHGMTLTPRRGTPPIEYRGMREECACRIDRSTALGTRL